MTDHTNDQMNDRMRKLLEECGMQVMQDEETHGKCSVCFRTTKGDLESTNTQFSPDKISSLIGSGHIVLNGCKSSGVLINDAVILFGIENRYECTHPCAHCKLFIAVPCDWKWTLNELHAALEKQRQAHSSRSTTTTATITATIAATITTIAATIAKTFFVKQ
jgi:hypothetical protein